MYYLYLSYQPVMEALSEEKAALEGWCRKEGVGEYAFLEEKLTNVRVSERMVERMLSPVGEGDVVVVTTLTRLGRGINMLCIVVGEILGKGASIHVIDENRIYSAGDDECEQLVSKLEFAARIVSKIKAERNNEALLPDHQQGIYHGRPVGSKKAAEKNVLFGKEEQLRRLRSEGMSAQKIAEALGVSRGTIYNYLKAKGL